MFVYIVPWLEALSFPVQDFRVPLESSSSPVIHGKATWINEGSCGYNFGVPAKPNLCTSAPFIHNLFSSPSDTKVCMAAPWTWPRNWSSWKWTREKKTRIYFYLQISSLLEFTAWSWKLEGRRSSGIDSRVGEREAGGEGCLNWDWHQNQKDLKASPWQGVIRRDQL